MTDPIIARIEVLEAALRARGIVIPPPDPEAADAAFLAWFGRLLRNTNTLPSGPLDDRESQLASSRNPGDGSAVSDDQ